MNCYGENVAQYKAELQRLSEHCDFKDYLSEALRDRLVCGLRSEGHSGDYPHRKTLLSS